MRIKQQAPFKKYDRIISPNGSRLPKNNSPPQKNDAPP